MRLRSIGDRTRFGADISHELEQAEALTRNNTRLNLNVALSYGGRSEIVAAAQAIAAAVAAGRLDPNAVTEAAFSAYLFTAACRTPTW